MFFSYVSIYSIKFFLYNAESKFSSKYIFPSFTSFLASVINFLKLSFYTYYYRFSLYISYVCTNVPVPPP